MKCIRIPLIVLFCIITHFNIAMSYEVNSTGKTILKSKNHIIVVLETIKSKTPPSLSQYYEKETVSMIEILQITKDGNNIFVPRSVFADLFDVNKALIKESKKGFVLSLWGGDAAESYKVDIFFNKERVTHRVVSSEESMAVTEETRYKLVVD